MSKFIQSYTKLIIPSDKPVGEYRIGDKEHYISFALKRKPHLFHRMMVRFFFGLRWIDRK